MKRRTFIVALVAGVATWPMHVRAQLPVGKIRRVGFLSTSAATKVAHQLEAFRRSLGELRWVENENLVIHYRFAEGRFERLTELAAELVRLGVDVIVAVPTPAALAAKSATTKVPIVMVSAADPVGVGLVVNLARPGGNVTGTAYSVGLGTLVKGLEFIREIVPEVRRVAILSNPGNPGNVLAVSELAPAAQSLGLGLQFLEARRPDDFDGAFAAMAEERAGAVLVVTDTLFMLHRARVVELAAKHRLPSMFGLREPVEAGGLMAYGSDLREHMRQAAIYVDKILSGANPADLPVEQPTKFELVVNLKTAKALGLTLPPSILLRADEVIE